ncbi:hypothetical protein GOP47_0008829 [Adiantum capillus-veneris]|uniref:SGNH hydrolase-type esterase domain-containing protein n=1 Tax=Adiantum capillus-veneris TaxID=13818 RepID=A0A9D4ZII9_ADICA|nr:hypothetical protein GOP47_0008829 [Adiantum capillus-veneris]
MQRLLQGALLLLPLLLQPSFSLNVIVIGDSTASDYFNSPSFYPQAGWATYLGGHFSTSSGIYVVNMAVGGQSSKSYYEQNLWGQVKSQYLSAGDYVFIQFGHNDQNAANSNVYTDAFTTYQQYLSIYVADTLAYKATPVLLTSISRAVWQDGVLLQTLGDYPAAVRQLASELGVALIDMNAKTTALFSELGETDTQYNLFMCLRPGEWSNYPNGDFDTTHLQEEGAKQCAALAAQGVAEASLSIGAYVV